MYRSEDVERYKKPNSEALIAVNQAFLVIGKL